VTEGDHRRAAGERLDHDEAERFRPPDGKQGAAGALVQLGLGLVVDLAAKVDVVRQVRLDRAGEVLPFGALVHLPGHDQAPPETPRDLDGDVGALLRHHPPDEEEVVVLLR